MTTTTTTPAPADRPYGRHAAPAGTSHGYTTPAYGRPEPAPLPVDPAFGTAGPAGRTGNGPRGPVGTRTATGPGSAGPRRGGKVALAVAALLAGAGIAAGLVYGLDGGSPAPAPADPVPAATAPAAGHHAVIPSDGGNGGHVTPPTPPAPPVSKAIETLQKELGQLNYYEGPVTGVMNAQTTQAITYLQRDAGLPQTGQMNAATQAALAHMLVSGNNQMGG